MVLGVTSLVLQQPALRAELVAPDTVQAGAPVRFTIRITNQTDKAVDAYFVGREIAFDIVVTRADGQIVWQRLAGKGVQMVLQTRIMQPEESLELGDTWRQQDNDRIPVPAGSYTVEGRVPGQGREMLKTASRVLVIR